MPPGTAVAMVRGVELPRLSAIRRRPGGAVCTLIACGVLACGHPATREECELLLEKSAELELEGQNITDPAVVSERIGAYKQARGDDVIAGCLGKTMTHAALACVRRAESAEAFDRCLY